jgi:hypothetical protein
MPKKYITGYFSCHLARFKRYSKYILHTCVNITSNIVLVMILLKVRQRPKLTIIGLTRLIIVFCILFGVMLGVTVVVFAPVAICPDPAATEGAVFINSPLNAGRPFDLTRCYCDSVCHQRSAVNAKITGSAWWCGEGSANDKHLPDFTRYGCECCLSDVRLR